MRRHNREIMARTAMVMALVLFLSGAAAIADSFSGTIASFSDDARLSGTSLETTAGDVTVGRTVEASGDILVRFVSIPIPRYAAIDSAFVSLLPSSSQGGAVCNAVIYAEDTGNASTFSTYSDFAARSLTDEVVYWDNLPTMVIFNWYHTPDLSLVIQEVIDRSDWSAGNALSLLIRDHNSSVEAFRKFWQYDYIPAYACSLIVYYTPQPEAGNVPGRRRRILVGKVDHNRIDNLAKESLAFRHPDCLDLLTFTRLKGR